MFYFNDDHHSNHSHHSHREHHHHRPEGSGHCHWSLAKSARSSCAEVNTDDDSDNDHFDNDDIRSACASKVNSIIKLTLREPVIPKIR